MTVSPPQQIQHQAPPNDLQEESKQENQAPQPQMLEPVKRMSVKSRSIFTPIDEGHSILSQHWATSTSHGGPQIETATSNVRALTIDPNLNRATSPPRAPVPAPTHNKNKTSISSTSDSTFAPPSRTNSVQLGPKRPVLQLQIPEEPSSAGSATADSNSPGSGTNVTSQRPRHSESHSSSVVLPPPSPSAASALLSAGATGPPNPFARPHPVSQPSQSSNNGNLIDTPVSALPSRFMNNEFLPSPSSFYPEWNFRGNDSNTLPSPLNFATPVVGTGPSFLREDSNERAGSSGNASGIGNGVKRKTPDAEEGGDAKRPKVED